MDNPGNRNKKLINFIESCGIIVNCGKNNARGHRGFFRTDGNIFRIDLSKKLDKESILKTLAHEFAHFIHYKYDKSLKRLDFIFSDDDEVLEELISITVLTIPKSTVEPIFKLKEDLEKEISDLKKLFQKSPIDKKSLEKEIKKTNLKYFLKHDRIRLIEGLKSTFYSIEELDKDTDCEIYLHLLSKQRALKKINAKISRLNKYYNSPTELFARSFELYISDSELLKTKAPLVYKYYQKALENNKIPLISEFVTRASN